MSISVVIPCYRSGATLPALIGRLLPSLEAIGEPWEVLLVTDGSPDDTWEVSRSLASAFAGVQAFRLSRNFGQHNAILAGIRQAQFDVIVTMDDDLQHRPEEIPTMLAALTPGLDLVYGIARGEEHGFFRSAASRLVKTAMASQLGVDRARDLSAFRVFRTRLRDGLTGLDGPQVSIDVALSWATTRVGSVQVQMDERQEGASNYSFRLLLKHAKNMILGYSTLPLRIVGLLGLSCGLLGVVLLADVLWKFFSGSTTVAGFTTIASMVAIFSGAQMIALGIIGEYIASIHVKNMGQPAYVIGERVGNANPAPCDSDVDE